MAAYGASGNESPHFSLKPFDMLHPNQLGKLANHVSHVVPDASGCRPNGVDIEYSTCQNPCWQNMLKLRSNQPLPEVTRKALRYYLDTVPELFILITEHPYCLPLYVLHAQTYYQLGYPDLAVGAAYKALLLSDALQDEADEYHDRALEALAEVIEQQPLEERIQLLKNEHRSEAEGTSIGTLNEELDVEEDLWLRQHYLPLIYQLLARSLLLCGCYRSVHIYVERGLDLYPDNFALQAIHGDLMMAVAKHLGINEVDFEEGKHSKPLNWSDKGHVRRELYPWNSLKPNRLKELATLNAMMARVAPKLEVRDVELPVVAPGANDTGADKMTQLGIFAREDIAAGETILDETSMLTANNRLQDALCDACSADLTHLSLSAEADVVSCLDCEAVFCTKGCMEKAMAAYHPAVCGKDVEAIAKDVPPAAAADSLYTLLLLRALALAETRECHPLELEEVEYIWGDFHGLSLELHWQPLDQSDSEVLCGFPRTLPFSFENNVILPFNMLEKMDIDIFANPQYDVWVFNTLYAKFRGTASARLSGLGGRAIRGPEVSAVHPMWCLANHSCDPNVSWEWGGSIKFWATEERPVWQGKDGSTKQSQAGIKKGEEVLNHYCDVTLPVKDRREWAYGSLGGDCRCHRCVWEAEEEAYYT